MGLSELAIRYFQQTTNDFQAVGIDGTSCSDARICDLPGLGGMNLPPLDEESQADPTILTCSTSRTATPR